MTTQNRRPITKTALLLLLGTFPAVVLVLGVLGSGCGLSVAGPLDFEPLGDAMPLGREASVDGSPQADVDQPDGGPCSGPNTCSPEKTKVLDCSGRAVSVCTGDQECVSGACAPWVPKSMTGVVVWLRADIGVTSDGGSVSAWSDQSGRGNDVIQVLPAARPVVNTAFSGGKPSIDFAGTGQHLVNATATLVPAGTAYAVLAVAKTATVQQGALVTLGLASPYSTSRYYVVGTTVYVHTDNVTNPPASLVENVSPVLAMPFSSVHSYAGAGKALAVFLNGVDRPLAAGVQGTEAGAGFSVAQANNAQFWNGSIAEVIVVAGVLAPAERSRFEAYAKARYALP